MERIKQHANPTSGQPGNRHTDLLCAGPVCLSIWLAHRQAEDKFVDALDSYASRVLIRTDRVVAQAKQALTHLQTFHAPPCTPRIYAKCVGLNSHGAIFRK